MICQLLKLTPQKSNIDTKISIFKGSYLFQTIIFGIHVTFRGCRWEYLDAPPKFAKPIQAKITTVFTIHHWRNLILTRSEAREEGHISSHLLHISFHFQHISTSSWSRWSRIYLWSWSWKIGRVIIPNASVYGETMGNHIWVKGCSCFNFHSFSYMWK